MWQRFCSSFHNSEVILWSRIQVVVGVIWVGIQGVDVSPIVKDPSWLMYWIIGSNVVNELLRRHRGEYDDNGNLK